MKSVIVFLRHFFSLEASVTKRQLGIILLVVGVGAFVGILAIDVVGAGREGGIGPAQQAALIGMAFIALLGATLIPLGDKPA